MTGLRRARPGAEPSREDLVRRLAEAEATIAALLSGQIDAVVDPSSQTPVLLWKAQEALRDSEERYRRIVETTNQGVWRIDADNQTTFMNRRMAEMLGCEADMGRGCSVNEFIDDAGRATLAEHIQRGGPTQTEVRFIRRDGSGLWTLVEATPLFDKAGQYEGSFAMVMNITERKQSEAALRAIEARFRGLWDSGVILITISDLSGKIIEVNEAGLTMLGYSRREMVSGMRWHDITPVEWHASDATAIAQLAASGVTTPWEKEVVRKNGSRLSILAAAALLNETEGIAIAIDLTKRKLAERDLLERMRLAALIADVGMLLTRGSPLDTALHECAEAMMHHLDVGFAGIWTLESRSSVLELRASAGLAIAPNDPHLRVPVGQFKVGRIAETQRAYMTNDAKRDSTAEDPDWDGMSSFAGHPLLVDDELVGVLAIFARTPISEIAFSGLSSVSDALAMGIRQNQVTRSNAALELQLRHSQKMEAVGRLAGGIAHDFNNILSVVLTCSEFLVADLNPLDPSHAEAEAIFKAGTRAAALTRQLLMFSRKQVLESKVLDLATVTVALESMLRRVLGQNIQLILRSDQQPARVRGDPGSIEQVIMNLVMNARDAMPNGGTVTIETSTEVADDVTAPRKDGGEPGGRQVVLSVTDTGTGMDAATQARIFEPFFTTKGVGKGTGLGLSTAFGIVQQSNGTIRVTSGVGEGSSFSICLPYVEDAVHTPVAASRTTARGTETVLLVEDEDEVRAAARGILQRSGYQVIEMRGTAEALAYCQTQPSKPIALLLTDVVMPHMSGPELSRHLIQMRPLLRVLCMSGYTDDAIVRDEVLKAHIAFIQKPFTPESLTRKIREVLDLPDLQVRPPPS